MDIKEQKKYYQNSILLMMGILEKRFQKPLCDFNATFETRFFEVFDAAAFEKQFFEALDAQNIRALKSLNNELKRFYDKTAEKAGWVEL